MIHWSQKVWGRDYKPIQIPSDDPELVGGWPMRAAGKVLTDESGNGKDGAVGLASQEVQTVLGPMRRYRPSTVAQGSPLGVANDFPLDDLTLDFWIRQDLGASVTGVPVSYRLDSNDQWSVRVNSGNNLVLFDDIDNAGANRYTTAIPKGKLIHVIAMMRSRENLLYVDKKLVGSGESSADDWASFSGTLVHGAISAAVSGPAEGLVGPLAVYNTAKSAAWIRSRFLEGASARQFYTGYGVHESIVDETSGYLSNTPIRIISGTWRIVTTEIRGVPCKAIKCIAAGRLAIPTSLFYATPTEAAFGGWRLWLYKGSGTTVPRVLFIAASTDGITDAAQFGYYLNILADGTPQLREMTGGGNPLLASGTTGGFPVQEWTPIDLQNRYDGLLSYHQDGVQDMSVTDLSYTTSKYIVLDFDALDMAGWSDPVGGHNIQKTVGPLLEAA